MQADLLPRQSLKGQAFAGMHVMHSHTCCPKACDSSHIMPCTLKFGLRDPFKVEKLGANP